MSNKTEGNNKPNDIINVISSAAVDQQCDVHKLQALIDWQMKIEEKKEVAEFNEAMISASGSIPQIERLGRASFRDKGSYGFARWEDMDEIIRPILVKHGLRLSFTTKRLDDGVVVVTGMITHQNGQIQKADFSLPPDRGPGRNEAQSFGSSLSYGKRYCAEMLLNIVRRDEDTDGHTPAHFSKKETINEAQKKEISSLLQLTGSDEAKFFMWARCNDLNSMSVDTYPRAKAILEDKLNKGLPNENS